MVQYVNYLGYRQNVDRLFKRLANSLIRLRVRAGWSEHLLDANTTLLEISCRNSFIFPQNIVTSLRCIFILDFTFNKAGIYYNGIIPEQIKIGGQIHAQTCKKS